MLSDEGIDWLSGELAATAEALGQTISENAAALMAADLSNFPQDQLRIALSRTRMECTGKLTLKAILDQLDALQGRLGGNEAWALALRARDERETVVWTDEVAEAWAVAAPMANGRDLVGARMAFKDAYERITQQARDTLKRPEPRIAVGWDNARRISVVTAAHNDGHIPLALALRAVDEHEVARHGGALVPATSAAPQVGYDAKGVPFKLPAPAQGTGMLALGGPRSSLPDVLTTSATLLAPNVVERIREIQAGAVVAGRKKARRAQAQARLDRMRLKKAKREANAAVAQRLAQEAGTA